VHKKQRKVRIEQHKGRYRARVTDPRDKTRKWIVRDTPEEVLQGWAQMARVRSDLALGLGAGAEHERLLDRALQGPLTVARAWENREAARVYVSRAEAYAGRVLVRTLGKVEVGQLDGKTMAAWWRELRDDYAENTARLVYYQLHRAVQLAVLRGLLPRIPWAADFTLPKKTRVRPKLLRSEGEVRALLEAAASEDARVEEPYPLRLMLFSLALGSGMRTGELAGLGWDHLAIDEPPFRVYVEFQAVRDWRAAQTERKMPIDRPRMPPKGGKDREIGLEPVVAAGLRLVRAQQQELGIYADEGPVLSRDGAWCRHNYVLTPQEVLRVTRLANVQDKITMHGFRHSFLSHGLQTSGGDLAAMAALAGHADVRTIAKTYLHAVGFGVRTATVPGLQAIGPMPAAKNLLTAPERPKPAPQTGERPDFERVWAQWNGQGARPAVIVQWAQREAARAARAALKKDAARRRTRAACLRQWDRWVLDRARSVGPTEPGIEVAPLPVDPPMLVASSGSTAEARCGSTGEAVPSWARAWAEACARLGESWTPREELDALRAVCADQAQALEVQREAHRAGLVATLAKGRRMRAKR